MEHNYYFNFSNVLLREANPQQVVALIKIVIVFVFINIHIDINFDVDWTIKKGSSI